MSKIFSSCDTVTPKLSHAEIKFTLDRSKNNPIKLTIFINLLLVIKLNVRKT
jgi:hypothetical protein